MFAKPGHGNMAKTCTNTRLQEFNADFVFGMGFTAISKRNQCGNNLQKRDQAKARVLGEVVHSATGATAVLAAVTTLETCWNVPSHEPLQVNYCTRNSIKNAIACRRLRIVNHCVA